MPNAENAHAAFATSHETLTDVVLALASSGELPSLQAAIERAFSVVRAFGVVGAADEQVRRTVRIVDVRQRTTHSQRPYVQFVFQDITQPPGRRYGEKTYASVLLDDEGGMDTRNGVLTLLRAIGVNARSTFKLDSLVGKVCTLLVQLDEYPNQKMGRVGVHEPMNVVKRPMLKSAMRVPHA